MTKFTQKLQMSFCQDSLTNKIVFKFKCIDVGRNGTGPPFPGSAIPTVRALGLGIGLGLGLGLGLGFRRTVGMADPGNGGPESVETTRVTDGVLI